MGSKPFQFKHFSVSQNQSTHKVGTDGVLLGAWANISEDDQSLLDIGTGSGVIALMLAQRTSEKARIDAVEIEAQDAEQAKENVLRSPWPQKIRIHHTPLQQYFPESQYDLIVTNPPFFVNSWLPPERKRSQARHTEQLTFEDLLINVRRLLKKQGRVALILPFAESLTVTSLARGFHLFPIRKTTFRSRANKPIERVLLELSSEGRLESETELTLYDAASSETWSDDYIRLTRDFYLNT